MHNKRRKGFWKEYLVKQSVSIKGTSVVVCDRSYDEEGVSPKGEVDLVIMDLVHLAGVVL